MLSAPCRIEEADRADRLLEKGGWEEARDIYLALRRAAPADPRAACGLGIIAFHQGRREEAENLLSSLPGPWQEKPEVAAMRALIALGRLDREDLGRRAQSPADPGEGARARGLLLAAEGEYAAALEEFLGSPPDGDEQTRQAFELVLRAVRTDSEAAREYRRRWAARGA